MTFQDLFVLLYDYRMAIATGIFAAPWLTWLLCVIIPGKREEPLLLSVNLLLSALSLMLWAGYLAYASSTGGWAKVVQQADILLLFAPLYYVGASLWVSKQRLPLERIPAFRMFQGLATIAAAYLLLSWFAAKIRIVMFSYIPLSVWLWLIAIIIGLGYWGYLRLTGQSGSSQRKASASPWDGKDVDQELARMKRQVQAERTRLNLNTLIVPLVLVAVFLGIWGLTLTQESEPTQGQPVSTRALSQDCSRAGAVDWKKNRCDSPDDSSGPLPWPV